MAPRRCVLGSTRHQAVRCQQPIDQKLPASAAPARQNAARNNDHRKPSPSTTVKPPYRVRFCQRHERAANLLRAASAHPCSSVRPATLFLASPCASARYPGSPDLPFRQAPSSPLYDIDPPSPLSSVCFFLLSIRCYRSLAFR